MMNHWLNRALEIIEVEKIILKQGHQSQNWYNKMPKIIPAICPDVLQPKSPEEFQPQVGLVHHLRLTKFGIEGVLKAPRKYHRYLSYILYDSKNKPNNPFWLILHK